MRAASSRSTAVIKSCPPTAELRPFVRHYYLFSGTTPSVSQITAAWTRQLLVMQCGSRIRTSLGGTIRPVRDAELIGPITTPYVFQPEDDRFVFFVVEFTDIGLSSLFGGDAGAFVDRSTDVMELVPADRRGMIIDALYEVDDVEQKVALVEQFLKEMLPSDDTLARVQLVRDAVTTIREASGWVSVQEVSDGLDVSERHLRRQFAETTGLSPKVFARILRFRGAIATLLESRDSTELFSRASRAMPADYTDQAHFNHEFKQFTGYAPTALPFDRFETYREYDRADELAARAE